MLTSWHWCCHHNKVNAGCTSLSYPVILSGSPSGYRRWKEYGGSLYNNHCLLMYAWNCRVFNVLIFAPCDVTNAFPIFLVKKNPRSHSEEGAELGKTSSSAPLRCLQSWSLCNGKAFAPIPLTLYQPLQQNKTTWVILEEDQCTIKEHNCGSVDSLWPAPFLLQLTALTKRSKWG